MFKWLKKLFGNPYPIDLGNGLIQTGPHSFKPKIAACIKPTGPAPPPPPRKG